MPFLFALYPVIYRISDYVPNITAQANKFLTIPDMTITPGNMLSMAKSGETMGYSAAALVITAILLPVLSAFTQYLNMKLSMAVNGSNRPADKDDPTAATMRTMNMTMPLFSLVMVFTLPTGIGIYWIVSAIVRMVQQVFINKHLSKISVDDMIEKNKEKAQKKKEKRGEKAEKINAMAQTNTKSIKSSATQSSSMSDKEREEKIKVEKEKQRLEKIQKDKERKELEAKAREEQERQKKLAEEQAKAEKERQRREKEEQEKAAKEKEQKEKEIQEKEKIDLIKKQQELEQASKVDTANTGDKISSEDVLETVKVTPKEEVVTDNNNANTSDGKLDVSKEKTHTTVVTEKKQVEIDAKDIGAPEVSQVVNTVAATPVVVEEEPEVLDMNVTVISPEQVLSAVKVGVKKEEPKVDNKSKRKKGKR